MFKKLLAFKASIFATFLILNSHQVLGAILELSFEVTTTTSNFTYLIKADTAGYQQWGDDSGSSSTSFEIYDVPDSPYTANLINYINNLEQIPSYSQFFPPRFVSSISRTHNDLNLPGTTYEEAHLGVTRHVHEFESPFVVFYGFYERHISMNQYYDGELSPAHYDEDGIQDFFIDKIDETDYFEFIEGASLASERGGDYNYESSYYYEGSAVLVSVTSVPVPAAGWLFMSALIGLVGKKRLARR